MIAKRIDTKAATSRIARLVKYVVAAQGGIDPRSWTRTADYVLNSGTSNRGEKVGGVRVTNCHTDDPAAATALIECTQAGNTRSKTDKTYHLVFSFPPGEEPPLDVLHAIEDQLCNAIGYADHQRISAVHIDCDHLHVHVAINRVHPKGYQNIQPKHDKLKLMAACERLELEYGLTRTNHGLHGEKPMSKRDNHIRIYRGESSESVKNGNWWTTNQQKAAKYGEVFFVDLPIGFVGNNFAQGHNGTDEYVFAGSDESWKQKIKPLMAQTSAIPPRQAQAEAHSGIETLIGFVSREVAPAIHKAVNWQQLHASLAEHGLSLKKRGAGLVIGTGETWVRASQCDRTFSLKGLSDRLGTFEENVHPAGTAYTPKPRQSHPSSAALFEIYQRDRDKYAKIRAYGIEQAKYEGAILEANLQKWKKAQRLLVKLADKGPTRRAMLKIVTLQVAATRKANWRTVETKRRKAISQTAYPTWAVWLSQQAEKGNTEALDVLRSRGSHAPMQGDSLTAENPATVILKRYQLQAGTNGVLTYSLSDGGLVIDRKTHVQSFRTTERSTLLSLELAAKRYKGQALIVEGRDDFKNAIARLAGTHSFDVRFADAALEKIRKESKPKGKSIINEVEI